MTSHARGFMAENQAETLREKILAATYGTSSRLAGLAGEDPPLRRSQRFLNARLTEAGSANARSATAALEAAITKHHECSALPFAETRPQLTSL